MSFPLFHIFHSFSLSVSIEVSEAENAMDVREEIQKRIDKKEEEIRECELKIRESKAYIQALSDTLRFLPKEPTTPPNPDLALRAGTAMAKAREAIKKAGKPLHINDILKALGRPVDRENRGSIAGSLSAYVRKAEIFTKVAPNTFGLTELGHGSTLAGLFSEDEPPESFGIDDNVEPSANGKVEELAKEDGAQMAAEEIESVVRQRVP
jgi:hypothetical protein